jgi:hypothetical protein
VALLATECRIVSRYGVTLFLCSVHPSTTHHHHNNNNNSFPTTTTTTTTN